MAYAEAQLTQGEIHGIRISITGINESFCFEVSWGEGERISRYFRHLSAGVRVKDFIEFESFDQTRDVLVRGREVTKIEFTSASNPAGGVKPGVGNVRIFTRGRVNPFVGTIWHPSDAAWLMTGLDSEPGAFNQFWTYKDVLGEPVSVRVSDIVLAEIDSAIVEEGLRLTPGYDEEEEWSEGDDMPF